MGTEEIVQKSELTDLIAEVGIFLRDGSLNHFGLAPGKKGVLRVLRYVDQHNYLTRDQIKHLCDILADYNAFKTTNNVLSEDFKRTYFETAEEFVENDELFLALYRRLKETAINSLDRPQPQKVNAMRGAIRKEIEFLRANKTYFIEDTFNRILDILEPDVAHRKYRYATPLENTARPRGLKELIRSHIPDFDQIKERIVGLREEYLRIHHENRRDIMQKYLPN